MTDMTALANKLAALIAEDEVYIAGARVISQGGDPPALVAILNEIDNTVLERTLLFGIDDVNLSMVVAGRRLRGIAEVSGNLPEAANVIGKPFAREEPEIVHAAGDMLTLLCVAATRVTVRNLPPRPLGGSADAGISAAGLADFWNIDRDAQPAPPMQRFLRANVAHMSAYMWTSRRSLVEEQGNTALLQTVLNDQAAAFRKRHKALVGTQTDPMLVCVEGAAESGAAIAIAYIGVETCVFAYEVADIGAIIASWYAITG
ncbi:hypothetical protein ACJ5NV_10595 [Loktanella agnita]|uniref:hypothetical protein n=1 Tax=Loktanella agnita TaxID=287097 RepID=UPI0039869FB5